MTFIIVIWSSVLSRRADNRDLSPQSNSDLAKGSRPSCRHQRCLAPVGPSAVPTARRCPHILTRISATHRHIKSKTQPLRLVTAAPPRETPRDKRPRWPTGPHHRRETHAKEAMRLIAHRIRLKRGVARRSKRCVSIPHQPSQTRPRARASCTDACLQSHRLPDEIRSQSPGTH